MKVLLEITNEDDVPARLIISSSDFYDYLKDDFGAKFAIGASISGKEDKSIKLSSGCGIKFPNGDFHLHSASILNAFSKGIKDQEFQDYFDEEVEIAEGLEKMVAQSIDGLGLTSEQIEVINYLVSEDDFVEVNGSRYFNVANFNQQQDIMKIKEGISTESGKRDSTLSSVTASLLGIPDKEGRFIPLGTISRRGVDIYVADNRMIMIDREGSASSIEDLKSRPLCKKNSLSIAASQDYEPPGVLGYSDSISIKPATYVSNRESLDKTIDNLSSLSSESLYFATMLLGDGTNSKLNPFPFYDMPVWENDSLPNIAPGASVLEEFQKTYTHKNKDEEARIVVVDSKVIEKLGGNSSSIYGVNHLGDVVEIKKGDAIRVDLGFDGISELVVDIDSYKRINLKEYEKSRERRWEDYIF